MTGIVYITRLNRFSAAHSYDVASLSSEEGQRLFLNGADPAGHGHNYLVETTVAGIPDPVDGMVVNVTEIDRVVKEEIVQLFDQRFINRREPHFSEFPSTTENLARFAWKKIEPRLDRGRLARIRVEETPTLWSEYEGAETEMVSLTRVFEFCASHRLYTPKLSDEENVKVYDKCANPHGHGHNYTLEVTVRGPVDDVTGTVADLPKLEQVVDEHVVERFDHRNLNIEIPEFRELVPTAENIAIVIWNTLTDKAPEIPWHKIKLWETPRNYFEYYGPAGSGAA